MILWVISDYTGQLIVGPCGKPMDDIFNVHGLYYDRFNWCVLPYGHDEGDKYAVHIADREGGSRVSWRLLRDHEVRHYG